MTTITVTVPNVNLTLDDLIRAVRLLEPDARAQIARALVQDDLDRRLAQLIQRLAAKEPPSDISPADIDAEIRSFRTKRR
jgi:hypothetical protein